MVGIVNETMVSFEERTYQAITDLEKGAEESLAASKIMIESAEEATDMIEEAAELTESTARKYSGELILPRTILIGDTLEIRYSGLKNVVPVLDIVDHEGDSIISRWEG